METIKSYITASGMSVADAAKRMNVAPSTLYRALNGQCKLKLETMQRIHELTGLALDKLLKDRLNSK
jgi:transcriptional regulator with XRE-family HTH domain